MSHAYSCIAIPCKLITVRLVESGFLWWAKRDWIVRGVGSWGSAELSVPVALAETPCRAISAAGMYLVGFDLCDGGGI